MKYVVLAMTALLLHGCGEESPGEIGIVNSGSSIVTSFENIGNSNVLLNCAEAAQQISSDFPINGISPQVELGMSPADIRAIVGKPRHIFEQVWTFGYDTPVNLPINPLWDLMPSTTVVQFGTTGFSGDNTVCDGSENQFIVDANALISSPAPGSYRNDVPDCVTAAKRIAAKVELGMSRDDVRDLVGKPVEIAVNGLWRYKYSPVQEPQDTPAVLFGDPSYFSLLGEQSEFNSLDEGDLNETSVVIGYWSPENVCL